jgi:hypothetical protein
MVAALEFANISIVGFRIAVALWQAQALPIR